MSQNILCIYHGHCMDGFTAAWVVRKALGPDIELHAATHGDPPPDVKGKHVIIVDFSYKRPVLLEMAKEANSLLVLDHHKSAEADLVNGNGVIRIDGWSQPLNYQRYLQNLEQDGYENAGKLIYALFDMERSGAGIAWDFFMQEARPRFVDVVEDRDLWRFNLDDTRNVCANIFSHEYTFENWDKLFDSYMNDPRGFASAGAAIERKHHKDIAELVEKSCRPMEIGGHVVPCANLPYTMGSDAGHLMCTEKKYPGGTPFAAYYWDSPEGRNFGLRSLPDGLDVSEIAKQYGGGGHKHAAGFRVPFGHELTK